MLSEKLAYLAARLRLDPADPDLPPLKPAILADILEGAAGDAAQLEGLPLQPSLTQPTHVRLARQTALRPRLVADGNVIHLIPAHRRLPAPPAPPQDGAA